jgi:hypothetical protein
VAASAAGCSAISRAIWVSGAGTDTTAITGPIWS